MRRFESCRPSQIAFAPPDRARRILLPLPVRHPPSPPVGGAAPSRGVCADRQRGYPRGGAGGSWPSGAGDSVGRSLGRFARVSQFRAFLQRDFAKFFSKFGEIGTLWQSESHRPVSRFRPPRRLGNTTSVKLTQGSRTQFHQYFLWVTWLILTGILDVIITVSVL